MNPVHLRLLQQRRSETENDVSMAIRNLYKGMDAFVKNEKKSSGNLTADQQKFYMDRFSNTMRFFELDSKRLFAEPRVVKNKKTQALGWVLVVNSGQLVIPSDTNVETIFSLADVAQWTQISNIVEKFLIKNSRLGKLKKMHLADQNRLMKLMDFLVSEMKTIEDVACFKNSMYYHQYSDGLKRRIFNRWSETL